MIQIQSGTEASGRRVLLAALVVVLAWAGLLRFTGITGSRLLLCDESYYLLEARRIVGQVHACEKIWQIWRRDRPAGLIHLQPPEKAEIEALAGDGYGQIGGRFGHDLLLAAGLLSGLPEVWGGHLIAALFGFATVLMIVAWSARAWGARAALFAGAVLGGSVVHLAYSRSVLCESDAIFFLIASLVAYANALAAPPERRTAWTLASGFAFGLAFVCNMRAVPVVYALVAFEITELAPRRSLLRLITFGAAAVVPLALAESLFHILFLFSGAAGVLLTRQSYVHSILWQFTRLHGGVMSPGTNLGQYGRYVASLENPLALVVWALGLAALAFHATRPGRAPERLLATAALALIGYWESAVGFKCLRYISPVVPLLALAAGLAFSQALAAVDVRAPRLAAPLTLALALLLVTSSSLTWSAWQGERPGYRDVADWLATQGRCRIIATQANYFRLRFPLADVELASGLEQVKELHARGFRWYVDCYQKYHWPERPALLQVQKELSRVPPRAFPQPMAGTPFNWYEAGLPEVPAEWSADAPVIKVWDLDAVFGPPATAAL